VVRFVATVGAFGAMIVSAGITAAAIQIAGNGIDDEHVPGVVVACVFGVITAVAAVTAVVLASRLGKPTSP
jgi:hypothetical protein